MSTPIVRAKPQADLAWWVGKTREQLDAEAKTRFPSSITPNLYTPGKPPTIFESTWEAIQNPGRRKA